MNYQDYIIEATDMVSAWELPDSALPQAIQDQAELMAGLDYHWHDNLASTCDINAAPF